MLCQAPLQSGCLWPEVPTCTKSFMESSSLRSRTPCASLASNMVALFSSHNPKRKCPIFGCNQGESKGRGLVPVNYSCFLMREGSLR